jgi:myosin heavy subunit
MFNKEHVLNQVRHLQIESVVTMTKKGFSYVKLYYDFYTRFRVLHPFDHKTLPYSLVDTYATQDSTLTDTKLVELCKVLLQQTIAAFKLTVR